VSTAPEQLSVRERIERRVFEVMQAAHAGWIATDLAAARIGVGQAEAAGVHRWDARGFGTDQDDPADADLTRRKPAHLDLTIAAGDESLADDGIGTVGLSEKQLPLCLFVHIHQSEKNPENTSAIMTRWLARLEAAITADVRLFTGGSPSVPLSKDVEVLGARQGRMEDNQPALVVALDVLIKYRHPYNDPYTPVA